jgi:serine/threonine protein kinase/nitrite reductase/ring-hydroxylating ferredoxin subunit
MLVYLTRAVVSLLEPASGWEISPVNRKEHKRMEGALLAQLVGQDVGECHLERLLSYGEVGAVYLARQRMPNRPVTLTLLLFPEGMATRARQQFSTRFLQEAPRLWEVHHPYLEPLEAYGEWEGFSFLATPAQPERSLATILGQHGRCPATTVLSMLEQITAGLEHAHCRGLVHGALSLSHLLVSRSQQIQIAGLGLQRLLERRGILPVEAPCENGLTLAGTWLVAQRYLAPECRKLGQAADIRSDVYALGVILGELLTGRSPWSGEGSLEPATEEGQHLLPMRPTQYVDLPPSLERVLHQACAADPDRRFQRVSDLLAAFAEALEEEERAAVASACWFCPLLPAAGTTEPEARHSMQENELPGSTPFPWEVPHTVAPVEAPALFARSQPGQQDGKRSLRRHRMRVRRGRVRAHRPRQVSRRRLLGLLVKGGAVGALGVSVVSSGYLLTTALLKRQQPQGSSRGHPQQALNTALVFTNPRDGQQGLLVRLPNGTFVAYERRCTHVGVFVNYNSQTHMLVCPAHGAIFDPAHGGRVVQGPATRPLPQVPLRQGSDGTILIGDGGALPPVQ